ncbi:MAG: phosphatase PAP2-related protein [Bacteroidales bacterium]
MNKRIRNNSILLKLDEMVREVLKLFTNMYFYIGVGTLFIGIELNFFSQKYLLNYIENGQSLPVLSDLILDNIPLWDIDYMYDIFSLFSLFVFILFIIHKRKYDHIPYFLVLVGIFQIVRGFFIVLTPFGNPMGFDGTDGPFNGFTDIELGVYPSGHTGVAYLYFLLVKVQPYRYLLLVSALIIIFTLFVSRGHYTIDILSGIFFAYAIKCFGERHLLSFFIPYYSNSKV